MMGKGSTTPTTRGTPAGTTQPIATSPPPRDTDNPSQEDVTQNNNNNNGAERISPPILTPRVLRGSPVRGVSDNVLMVTKREEEEKEEPRRENDDLGVASCITHHPQPSSQASPPLSIELSPYPTSPIPTTTPTTTAVSQSSVSNKRKGRRNPPPLLAAVSSSPTTLTPTTTTVGREDHFVSAVSRTTPTTNDVDPRDTPSPITTTTTPHRGGDAATYDMNTLLYRIVRYSIYASIGIILSVSITIVPLSMIGHRLGAEKLDGASVGLFMLYIFAQHPVLGLGMALDTLCSQEFGRNHTSQIMGIILRRGIIVGQIASVIMSFFLLYIAPYFLALFYTAEVVMDVGDFLRPVIIYLTLLNFHTCLGKFCFNQLRPMLPIVSMGVGAVIVSPLASYVLVPYGLTATMVGGICVPLGAQSVTLVTLILRDEALRHTLWLSCPWWASDVVDGGEATTSPSGGGPHMPPSDEEEAVPYPDSPLSPIIPSIRQHYNNNNTASSHFASPTTTTTANQNNNNNSATRSFETNTSSMNSHVVANTAADDNDENVVTLCSNTHVFMWKGFNEYTAIALPSTVLIVGEGSAYDLSVLMAAVLGRAAGATWSAILNYTTWYVAVSGGISSAANALVGSALGRGDGQLAHTYARLVVGLSLATSALNSIIIIISLDAMLDSFGLSATTTTSPDSSEIIPTLSHQIGFYMKILMPIYHMGECLQVALQGVFGGLRRSDLGAKVMMGTLWIIGVPLSILLGFYVFPQLANSGEEEGGGMWCIVDPDTVYPTSPSDLVTSVLCSDQIGVVGIVIGLIVAMCVECPSLLYALFTYIDWDEAARLASGEEGDE